MSDSEDKVTFEELSPSLQNMFKNKVSIADLNALADKFNNVNGTISDLLNLYIKKTELWQAFHKLDNNYVPSDTSNNGWNKLGMCIIDYNIDSKISQQPQRMGQLLNIPYDDPTGTGKSSTQLWIDQPEGIIRFRAANDGTNINDTPFTSFATQDSIYPVGAIYLTTRSGNPSSYLKFGTWVQIKDCYLYCRGDQDSDVNPTSDRSGSNTVNIGIDNMPLHNHGGGTTSWNGDHYHGSMGENSTTSPYGLYDVNFNHFGIAASDFDNSIWRTSTDGGHNHTFSTNNTGGGQPLSIAPLRIPVYAWARIS